MYVSSGGSSDALSASAPRLLVAAGTHALCEVVEEFVGTEDANGHYLSNSVTELFLEEEANVKHGYVQVRCALSPCVVPGTCHAVFP